MPWTLYSLLMRDDLRRERPATAWNGLGRVGQGCACAAALGLLLGGRGGMAGAQGPALHWQAAQTIGDTVPAVAQHDPAWLLDSDGALNAIWVDDGQGPGTGLLASRRPAGSAAWSSPQQVFGLAALPSSTGAAVLAEPALAEGLDGRLHALWTLRRRGAAEIWHAARDPGARAWVRADRVDAGSDLDRADPDLAVDRYGVAHAIWTEGRAETDIVHSLAAADGRWSLPQRLNTPAAGSQRRPVLLAAPDGNLYAAWEDDRLGRSSIAASRLPPGGDVWWPNAILGTFHGGAVAHRSPVLAVDPAGLPSLLWLEERGRGQIRKASLPAPDAFWRDDGVLYSAGLGPIVDLAGAAGGTGAGALLWTESRNDAFGDRLYSAVLDAGGLGPPRRVDLGRGLGHAASPHVLLDGWGRVQALWLGLAEGDGIHRLRTAAADPVLAAAPQRLLTGRLVYAARPQGCPTESYALLDCSGAWVAYLRPDGADLVPFLGSWVAVEGAVEALPRCSLLRVQSLRIAAGPCPANPAVLTGRVSLMQRPLEGATVQVAGSTARSGPSGRYVLAPAPLGQQDLKLQAPCALAAQLKGLRIIDGFNPLPEVALRPGDLDQDCVVGLGDLVLLARQLGLAADLAQPACTDLDGDGGVTIHDLAPIAANLGASCAPREGLPLAELEGAARPPSAVADAPLGSLSGVGAALRLGPRAAGARVWFLSTSPVPLAQRPPSGQPPFVVVAEGLLTLRNQVTPDGRLELLVVRPPARAPLGTGATLAWRAGGLGHRLGTRLELADDLGRSIDPDGRWASETGRQGATGWILGLPNLLR